MLPDHYMVVDVETTGIGPVEHRIVEFAVAEVCDGKTVGAWVTLINPMQANAARSINGLADDVLAQAPRFYAVADEIEAWLDGGLPIVAHNAPFDAGFVRAEMERIGRKAAAQWRWSCSRDAARAIIPGLPAYGLQPLAAHLGIEGAGAHRAAADVAVLVALVERLRGLEADAKAPLLAPASPPPPPAVLLVDRAAAAMAPLAVRLAAYRERAATLTCDDDEGDERVSKAILAFKALAKSAEDLRGTFTGDLRAQTKAIETAWRQGLLAPIEATVADLLRLREPLALARARAAADARRLAEAEAATVAQAEFDRLRLAGATFDAANATAEAVNGALLEQAAAVVVAPVQTALGTVRDSVVYDVEIVDRQAVPRQYWAPDLDMIRLAVTCARGEIVIPGVVVTPRIVTTTRRKG